MMLLPSVLCPIDFSEASRGALRYATAIAEHFGARLTVCTVDDPLLNEAAELAHGAGWMVQESQRELEQFFKETFAHRPHGVVELHFRAAIGKPAPEILRMALEGHYDAVVMGSHGLTGARKLFFGSTTERVLRETSVPVLVTPATDLGPAHVEDVKRIVKRILAPVDLTAATKQQVEVARGLAEALEARLILVHVVEPTRPARVRLQLPSTDLERRARAEQTLNELASAVPPRLSAEGLVVAGDPAEEIAKIVHDRGVGLIVMGLHASPHAGPRMGSVTYRVLCLAPRLVLALPPAHEPKASVVKGTGSALAAADG